MRSGLVVLSAVALLFCLGLFSARAEEGKGSAKGSSQDSTRESATSQAQETSEAIEVGNTTCPVSGQRADSMGKAIQYEHEGKIYNFCCSGCVGKFKADPEKYIQLLKETGELDAEGKEQEKGSHGPEDKGSHDH